jgi:hypothetical protein
MRWAGQASRKGEIRNARKIVVRKPEGDRLLGRLRHGWEHNIKMEIGRVVDWIQLAQDRIRFWAIV